MSGTMYRRGITLNDLLANVGSGTVGGGGGIPSPREQVLEAQGPGLNDLLTQAFSPPDLGPGPTPYKPNWGNKIAAAIGDAAAAYGRAFAPQMQATNYQAEQRGRKAQSQAEQDQFAREKALAASESGRDKARYKLDQRDKALIREDQQAAAKQLRDDTIAQQNVALKQAASLAAAENEAAAERQKNQLIWDEKKAGLERSKDLAVAAIHAGAKEGDEGAKYDVKALPSVLEDLGALADGAGVSLGGGDPVKGIPKMTAEQLLKRADRIIEVSAMTEKGKAAARAFAHKEIGQGIKDYEDANAPIQGPENQSTLPQEFQNIKEAIGNVGSGVGSMLRDYVHKRFAPGSPTTR